jgi:hypothetical protein
MRNLTAGAALRQRSRQLDPSLPAATPALWALLRRLPAPLAELRDPADRAALTLATRRNAVRLMLSAGTVYVARARP